MAGEMIITDKFPLLEKLFGEEIVKSRQHRLRCIYETSEKKWHENLTRLKGIPVKYLLIAEAPPWTENGKVRYFYNAFDGQWCIRVWHTFFPNESIPNSIDDGLTKLAEAGFVLIDSLPFAMNYSSKRKHSQYSPLVKECIPFLMDKINNREIDWAKDVRVALAFKLNGLAIINAFPEGLRLPTKKTIHLREKKNIAADSSGYTSPKKLRSIFSIEE